MKKLNASLIAFIFAVNSSAFAAGTESNTGTNTTTAQNGQGITDSANNTASDNKKGQLLNMAVGAVNFGVAAMYASQCADGDGGACAMSALFFLMGAQNMAQSGAQGSTAGQAAGTYAATDALSGSGYDPNAVNTLTASDPDLKSGMDFAASVAQGKAGFAYDPAKNTVTTAKGTTISGNDLNSASSLAAAGVPQSAIDQMYSTEKDVLAKAQAKVDKLSKTSVAVNSGEESGSGGGGSGGFGPGSGAGGAVAYGAGAKGLGLGVNRDPAQVAGMQKNYNGEPIGVAGDSIFKMMTRRYKVKESQSTFLEESELLIQK